ncbi:MAG: SLC13/DASS family transporter [Prevotella sp.]|nr:SLC13/DASS family transporter [Prevotella sp.]
MSEQKTTASKLTNNIEKKKVIELVVIALATILVWNLPTEVFGIDGLNVVQQRIIAIFVFATLSWLTEAIPSWATSLAIITIMCLTVTDNSLLPFKVENPDELLKAKAVMASFADPVIMLFLGGFILAIAATKSGLDVVLAKNLIRPFGKKSENVLLGFLLITGLFSMFVSNTATAAMMLTFLTPVFAALPANGKGRIALTMSIPVAANIGGMGTPIGTPPNAIALKYLNDPEGLNLGLGFGEWMAFMFPLAIIILLISWRIILYFFPFTKKTIELEIKGEAHKGWRMWVVVGTFITTILLWVIPKEYTGIDANTVALVPMGVFALTGVITAKDLREIDWAVIWMVAGGFALGLGMNGSGLADRAIESIPFGEWSPIVILVVSGLICYFLSNFISNTATAALLVPILAVVCTGMGDKLGSIGGTPTVLIGIALAASSAMCLPISTPPNAIAYSTGLVEQKHMLKIGLSVGVISMILGYSLLFAIGRMGIL